MLMNLLFTLLCVTLACIVTMDAQELRVQRVRASRTDDDQRSEHSPLN